MLNYAGEADRADRINFLKFRVQSLYTITELRTANAAGRNTIWKQVSLFLVNFILGLYH